MYTGHLRINKTNHDTDINKENFEKLLATGKCYVEIRVSGFQPYMNDSEDKVEFVNAEGLKRIDKYRIAKRTLNINETIT